MRVTPFILTAIGIWGLIYPETLLDEGAGGGRWIFAVILLLGVFTFWRARTFRAKRRNRSDRRGKL